MGLVPTEARLASYYLAALDSNGSPSGSPRREQRLIRYVANQSDAPLGQAQRGRDQIHDEAW
ncbi:MAG TPA: hypothetical protein VMM76_25425 [Pirellulaceae bacterium]|nr:hypothetical protein [Pirellulaceae bacterium]